ncbi:hypothetical protein HDU98_002508 [Podochytrium sp. JEL0797]|nr:hypothetical protein HDU98_002508 [Podochytrium sp. JEL0797]
MVFDRFTLDIPILPAASAPTTSIPSNGATFLSLHHDLFLLIFTHLHPRHVLQYRRVCHTFDTHLSTYSFAFQNLLHFSHIRRREMQPQSYYPDELDRLWFILPVEYQHAYTCLVLTHVREIDWAYAKLPHHTPRIPVAIGTLAHLTRLELCVMDLRGTVPREVGRLVNLVTLNLSCNRLIGEVPREIGELKRLMFLNLCKNELGGCVPAEVGELKELRSLDLSENRFEGALPREMEALKMLRELNVSRNALVEIPGCVMKGWASLVTLLASENALGGNIAREVGALKRLTTLDLSRNEFLGEIPAEIGEAGVLEIIKLAGNHLTGSIPSEMGRLLHLRRLDLSNNELSGEILRELANAENLQYVNLTNNELSGRIPEELGTGRMRLLVFRVSGNRLDRPVPKPLRRVVKFSDRIAMDSKKRVFWQRKK